LNRWLVVHNLLAYRQHPDMIGNKVKESGVPEPIFPKFNEIKKGDQIVYYATRDMVIIGIFEVISDKVHLQKDPQWEEMVIFKTKPVELPMSGYYLSLKKLALDPSVHLDGFPQKKRWGSYLQGRACKLLTEEDFRIIKNALSNEKYLKSIQSLEA
jgi:hypothetical protein